MKITAQILVEFEQVAKACYWNEQQFHDTLVTDGSIVQGHYCNNKLVAYLLAQCVCDDCELLQITVHPSFKRQGIGNNLIQQLINQLKAQSYSRRLLEVREGNTAAFSLYQKIGFNIDGIRKGYYSTEMGHKENAVLMSLLL
jgi:ribosomal-protein-alanine N-acetyltransferase